jgi:hypothetical protein
VNFSKALPFSIIECIGEQAVVQLLQLSGSVIVRDHLPPVPALNIAERGLERIVRSGPV